MTQLHFSQLAAVTVFAVSAILILFWIRVSNRRRNEARREAEEFRKRLSNIGGDKPDRS